MKISPQIKELNFFRGGGGLGWQRGGEKVEPGPNSKI